jgi:hypothetical protein
LTEIRLILVHRAHALPRWKRITTRFLSVATMAPTPGDQSDQQRPAGEGQSDLRDRPSYLGSPVHSDELAKRLSSRGRSYCCLLADEAAWKVSFRQDSPSGFWAPEPQ